MQKRTFQPDNSKKFGGRMTKPTPRTKITERQSVPATIIGHENPPDYGFDVVPLAPPEQHTHPVDYVEPARSHSGPTPKKEPVPVHQSPKFSTIEVRKPVITVFEPTPQRESTPCSVGSQHPPKR